MRRRHSECNTAALEEPRRFASTSVWRGGLERVWDDDMSNSMVPPGSYPPN